MDDKAASYIAAHGKPTKPEKSGVGWLEGLALRWYGAKGAWRARADDPHEKPLVEMVESISKELGFKKTPEAAIYENENPEMIKIPGALVFSTALLDTLTPDEVKSIIAHQLVRQSHILRDRLAISGIGGAELAFEALAHKPMHHMVETYITKNPIKQIALLGAEKLATMSAAAVVENYYDSSCIFEADYDSAKITGQPKHMIAALEKIEEGKQNFELKERGKRSRLGQAFEDVANKYEPSWANRVRKTGNPLAILHAEPSQSSRVKALKILSEQTDAEKSSSPALSSSR